MRPSSVVAAAPKAPGPAERLEIYGRPHFQKPAAPKAEAPALTEQQIGFMTLLKEGSLLEAKNGLWFEHQGVTHHFDEPTGQAIIEVMAGYEQLIGWGYVHTIRQPARGIGTFKIWLTAEGLDVLESIASARIANTQFPAEPAAQ